MKIYIIFTISLFAILSFKARTQSPPSYEVFAIAFTNAIRSSGKEIAVRNAPDSIDELYMVWLVKGNNGKLILIDAGFVLSDSAIKMDKTGYTRPDIAVGKLNINPVDITDIIITHPHGDHIGGINLFPRATIWMQKDDYDYFVGQAWQKDGQHYGFEKDDVRKIVNANLEERLKLIKGDDLEIMQGIRVFIGSKHTYESQYVQINTGKEKIIIASDNIWFYFNYNNLISIPATFDTSAYVSQMKRMKTLASEERLIIPGHDAMILSRFPKITKGVVKISK